MLRAQLSVKAFSKDRESATLTITRVNDAPVVRLSGTIGYVRDARTMLLAAAGTRKIIFTVSDGKGGVSLEAFKTVNVL